MVVAAAVIVAIVVIWRRSAGLLLLPQGTLAWMGLALGIALGSIVVWAAWQEAETILARRCRRRLLTWYAVAAIAIATAYSGPNVRGTGLALVWLAAVTAVSLARPSRSLPAAAVDRSSAAQASITYRTIESKSTDTIDVNPRPVSRDVVEEAADRDLAGEFTLPEDVWQQWTRGLDGEGNVFVSGMVRIPVPTNARVVHCHLPLHPPASPPLDFEIEPTEETEGLEIEWEVGASLPQGVRFDGRIKGTPSDGQTVTVAFYGTQTSVDLRLHDDVTANSRRSSS